METLINELIEVTEAILELRKREYNNTSGEPVRYNEWETVYTKLDTVLTKIKNYKNEA